MRESLKEVRDARDARTESRQNSDRIAKIESKRDNVIHDGLTLNPRPGDLAVEAGELYHRDEDNENWELLKTTYTAYFL